MPRLFLFAILAACACLATAASAADRPGNPNTDWFSRAGYGVFVHYLSGLQNVAESSNSLGKQTSWDACVREFNVEAFAGQMRECGAGYVIFTVMQVNRFMIAPNATYDRLTGYKPGEACAKRDLIEELYQALQKRGIPLMLYYTGDGPRGDAKAAAGMKCPPDGQVTEEFVRNWAAVAREYGERYKGKVTGYWCDGCYPFIGYDDKKLGILAQGLRAGNPKRIISMNNGVNPKVISYTRHEDFTTGEMNTFTDVPLSRWIDGEQWHLLSFLGGWWGGPGLQLSRRQLIDYVHTVNAVGGVVSIDVMLYRDGLIERSQLMTLKGLRAGLKAKLGEGDAWKRGKAVPPRNKAWRRMAALLSLDGSRRLIPSVGENEHGARLGVDGDPNTSAVGGGEYPWTYEVDLASAGPLRRVVVTFTWRGYAVAGDIKVSADGARWETVHSWEDGTGGKIDLALPGSPVRFIRVCGRKPDGPDQPGIQMAVTELEAYE
jgi:hypothetical protein